MATSPDPIVRMLRRAFSNDDGYRHLANAIKAAADKNDAVRELADALRLTREYVGAETLPAVEGWSWYDALRKHAPDMLDALTPPRPPEPTGLGAVVLVSGERKYVRTDSPVTRPWLGDTGSRLCWGQLTKNEPLEVLSEGVS